MNILRHFKLIALIVACVVFLALAAQHIQHQRATLQTSTATSTTQVATSSLSAATSSLPRSAGPAPLHATSGVAAIATTSAVVSPGTSATLKVGATNYALSVPEGSTLAVAMQQLASTNPSFSYTTKQYPSLGLFVDSINGKANTGNMYWFLYVNGEEANTGISSTLVHQRDVIEWKYQI